ncbi:hypothetical protein ACOME3_001005 [Neoechinorhynchus agilis]
MSEENQPQMAESIKSEQSMGVANADATTPAAPFTESEQMEVDNSGPAAAAAAAAANNADGSGAEKKKATPDIQALPTRAYLDRTVVPILLQALSQVARERPQRPIEYLATYLLSNKAKYEE